MYAHKRLDKDKNKDFIHVDPTDTALIYLSETNINSGTVFYRNVPDSDKPQLIGDVKFIQSNCVFLIKGCHTRVLDIMETILLIVGQL